MKELFIIGAKEDIPGLVFNKKRKGYLEKVELSEVSVLFQSAVAMEELEKAVIQNIVVGATNNSCWSGAGSGAESGAGSGAGAGAGAGSTILVRVSFPRRSCCKIQG